MKRMASYVHPSDIDLFSGMPI